MGFSVFQERTIALLVLVGCSHTSHSVNNLVSSCPSENDVQLAQSEKDALDSAMKLRKIAIRSGSQKTCSFSVSERAREALEQLGPSYLSKKYKISLESFDYAKKKNPTVTFGLMLRDQGRISEFQECLLEEAQFLSDSSLILLWEFYKEGLPPLGEPYQKNLRNLLLTLSEEGHPRVQLWMGFIHARGLGVSPSNELAEKWWKLSDLPQAKTALGLLYFSKNELEKAEALLLESVKSDPEAPYILGKLYRQQKQYSRALAFFKKQVQSDPNNSEAHLEIGKMYLNSEGLSRDCRKVRRHFHFAADKLNDSKAQYALGMSYASKEELNPCFRYSLNRAKQYLKSSMEQGNPDARKLYESLFN